MDGFHTFSTGNRKRFIEQAKKKKQQTVTINNPIVHQKQLVMIQAFIRRFLNSKKIQTSESSLLFLLKLPVEAFGNQHILQNLSIFQQNNSFLFNYIHRKSIIYMESIREGEMEKSQRKFSLQYLGRYCHRVRFIFKNLSGKQKQFWVKNILTNSQNFSLNLLSRNQLEQVHKIITENSETFINIIGNLKKNEKLVYQLIRLACSYPCHHLPIPKPSISREIQSKIALLPLDRAYQNVNQAIKQKSLSQIGQYPVFFLQTIDLILKLLYMQCRLSIMQNYKIDPIYLKSEGEFIQEVIKQKQQWHNFMDFLNVSNKFNISAVHWFINLNNYQQSLKSSSYISTILQMIAIQFPLQTNLHDLIICFNKITEWIKVHEITTNQQQQLILLPLSLLIDRKFFQLTDKQFISFTKKEGQIFQKIIKDKLIKMIYKIVLLTKNNELVEKIVKVCVHLLEEIYNKIFRTDVFTTQIFVNEALSKKLIMYSQAKSDNQIVQFLHKFPFIFSIKDRARKFRQAVTKNYEIFQDNYYQQMYLNGKIKIRRGLEFEDAFNQLKNKNIKKGFTVTFIDQFGTQERGVDAGGLTKQFINRVLKAAFKPEFGMFVQNSEKQLLADPKKSEYETGIFAQYYEFIGKMIGKALFEGFTIGPKFCGPFLNTIIGKKNHFDDLRKIDKQLYNSLTYIKTMSEDAQQLCLTFQYRDQTLKKYINLKKNGSYIKVTNENKQQYISLLANYKVNKLLQFQSRHIRKGLKKVINSEWLFMFNYEELNYLISGSGEIKVHELRSFTKYYGYTEKDLTIALFWQVVSEFDQQSKSNLLMFVTGCPRPSFLGFEDMSPPFTIVIKQNIASLPISHTCSNILQLPNYKNKQILAEKLRTAINQCSGFELA